MEKRDKQKGASPAKEQYRKSSGSPQQRDTAHQAYDHTGNQPHQPFHPKTPSWVYRPQEINVLIPGILRRKSLKIILLIHK
jgi:hypothetical protein